jgi:hypothetical protein
MPWNADQSIIVFFFANSLNMMARIEQQVSLSLLDSEKQDVCHLATMLMEVGT